MPLTSPGNDDDTGENHQPTLRKNTAEPVEQTLKQNIRGEDPDREAALRTASEHSADRGEDRPGQIHREPRAEARPVVRFQRERVVPPLPAETAEDRAVDLGSVLFGAGRAEKGRPASARIPQAASHGLGPASRLGAGRAAQGGGARN